MTRAADYTTISSEGGLLPANLLARVIAGDRDLEAIGPESYHLAPGERLNEAITRSWNRLVGAWASFSDSLARATSDDHTFTESTRKR